MVALIDFGTCGVGDPSCDLTIAWTLLDRVGGQAIRERLDLDASTWARGRGWALWKSLSQLVNAIDDHDEAAAAEARRVIDGLLEDYSTGPCPRPTNGRRGHAPTTSRTRRPTVTPSGHSSTKHAGTRCHDQHDDAAERVKMTVAGSRTKREATPQLVEGRSGVCRHSELNVRCGTYAGRRERISQAGRVAMAHICGEVEIEAPVDEVFDFVADERNEPSYNPRIVRAEKLGDGPVGEGSRFVAQPAGMGSGGAMTVEILEYDRPHRFHNVIRSSYMQVDGTVTFTNRGGGTLLRWDWDMGLTGPMKIFSPVLALIAPRWERRNWVALKRYLESRQA